MTVPGTSRHKALSRRVSIERLGEARRERDRLELVAAGAAERGGDATALR